MCFTSQEMPCVVLERATHVEMPRSFAFDRATNAHTKPACECVGELCRRRQVLSWRTARCKKFIEFMALTPVRRSPLHAPMSPRWTLGTPHNAHGRRASHPGNVVSTPTTPATSCPHNPLRYKYYMTPTGCAPLTGGNRSYPIFSWVGH